LAEVQLMVACHVQALPPVPTAGMAALTGPGAAGPPRRILRVVRPVRPWMRPAVACRFLDYAPNELIEVYGTDLSGCSYGLRSWDGQEGWFSEAFCVTVTEPGPEARLVPAAAEAGPAEPALPDVVLVDDLRVPEVREVVLKAELASPRGDILVSTAHISPLPVQPQ